MDTEIAQLNERLTSLEREFAVQAEVAAVERSGYATREDIARIEAALANCATKQEAAQIEVALANCATKQELARVEAALANCATKQELARVEVALANCATKEELARIEASLAAAKVDIARIDAVLDSIQKNYSTKADVLQLETRLAQMETRITRWMLATLMTVAGTSGGAVFAVVKLLQ